ncbi:MAG: type II secretion system protein [Gemmatimonadaceae bacterium]|nr:type II secretion system protein [Gemmatimonadaceae bacterium]
MTRRGFSLLEVIVVTAILGLLGVVALGSRMTPRERGVRADQEVALRRRAVNDGRPHTDTVRVGDQVMLITAYPDGRVTQADPRAGAGS